MPHSPCCHLCQAHSDLIVSLSNFYLEKFVVVVDDVKLAVTHSKEVVKFWQWQVSLRPSIHSAWKLQMVLQEPIRSQDKVWSIWQVPMWAYARKAGRSELSLQFVSKLPIVHCWRDGRMYNYKFILQNSDFREFQTDTSTPLLQKKLTSPPPRNPGKSLKFSFRPETKIQFSPGFFKFLEVWSWVGFEKGGTRSCSTPEGQVA